MFRFASSDDAQKILKIYSPYVLQTTISFEYEPPSLSEFRHRMTTVMLQYPYLVSETDGEILGYAYASPFRSRAAYAWDCELSIYLSPAAQGRHIGTALYDRLLRLLTAQGYKTVYGVITYPNEKSMALHRKFGFTTTGMFQKSGYKLGQWLDVVILEKSLSSYTAFPATPIPCHTLSQKIISEIMSE